MLLDYGQFGSIRIPFYENVTDLEWYRNNRPDDVPQCEFDSDGHQIYHVLARELTEEEELKGDYIHLANKNIQSELPEERAFERKLVWAFTKRWGNLPLLISLQFLASIRPSLAVWWYSKYCIESLRNRTANFDGPQTEEAFERIHAIKIATKELENELTELKLKALVVGMNTKN